MEYKLHYLSNEDDDSFELESIGSDPGPVVVSQKSMHLLSQPHPTSVNVMQFNQDNSTKEDEESQGGKTIVFYKPNKKPLPIAYTPSLTPPLAYNTLTSLTSTTPVSPLPVDPLPESPVHPLPESPVHPLPESPVGPLPESPIHPLPTLSIESLLSDSVPKKENKRIISSLKFFAHDNRKKKSNKCLEVLHDPELSFIRYPQVFEASKMSEDLKKSQRFGCLLTFLFLLPVLPKACAYIWLIFELAVSVCLLIISLIGITYMSATFITISVIVSVLMVDFACIDAFLNIVSHFSCISVICPIKWFKNYAKSCEIIRTIVSEILLYPMIVLCLYELLTNGMFDLTIDSNKIAFALFIISCVYVLLSVYIVRPILIIVTIIRLQLITSSFNDYAIFFIRFLLHVIGQIVVHILCIVSVAMKIQLEGSITSPFLWIVMIGGWVIPLMGTISFFIVNYYWVQSLCVDVFIDVVKYLIKPEYSEAVFQSDNNYIEDSEKFFQITRHSEIMNEMETNREKIKFKTKFLYPLKVPLFILYGVTFCIIIAIYIVGLILDYNPGSTVTAGFGVDIGLTIFTVIAANLHFIMLTSLWCVIVILVEVPLIVIWPLWLTAKLIKNRLSKQSHDSNEYISLV
jgi:hypothetical protein